MTVTVAKYVVAMTRRSRAGNSETAASPALIACHAGAPLKEEPCRSRRDALCVGQRKGYKGFARRRGRRKVSGYGTAGRVVTQSTDRYEARGTRDGGDRCGLSSLVPRPSSLAF